MSETLNSGSVSTRLVQIAKLAREHPNRVFMSVHHAIDVELLREAYRLTRKDAPPVKRVHIPKGDGRTRPIGIPTFEDKVLQRAVAMVLEAIYEQDFHPRSFGFRPGRSAHASSGADARRVMEVLPKRFGRYGLTLHPEKTRLVKFHRPRSNGRNGDDDGGGPGSFDFLGFTHRWEKSRKGTMVVRQETARSRFTRSLARIREWCRFNRHRPVSEQSKTLGLKLRGHYNYYGLLGNSRALKRYANEVRREWEKWLARRSQNATSRWDRFQRIFQRYPLPAPRLIRRGTQLQLSEPLV